MCRRKIGAIHATGFLADRLLDDSAEKGDGAAVYAELRAAETTAIGVETSRTPGCSSSGYSLLQLHYRL